MSNHSDTVNHPKHYNEGKIEAIEAIAAAGHAESFCIGNCMKYLWRYKHKNGEEDLAKALFYLTWYIDYLKRDETETSLATPDTPSLSLSILTQNHTSP